MKYLKRIYENFSSESDFEAYLKNHFEDILDEDNSTYKVRLQTRKENGEFHTRIIIDYSTFISPNQVEEGLNMKRTNEYLSRMSDLFSKINDIIRNFENDPNLSITYIHHEDERIVISIKE